MNPFKAPTKVGLLGVEAESYAGHGGQLLTSLPKLNQARFKKHKFIGQKSNRAI